MKRTASQAFNTESATKKRKLEIWVSPSAIRNYMIDDPCVDWLKALRKDSSAADAPRETNLFFEELMKQGNLFEEKVVAHIRGLFRRYQFRKIVEDPMNFDEDLAYAETLQAVEDGVPVIYQAYLQDADKHLRGIPDLLVRSDYLSRIIDNPPELELRRVKKGNRKVEVPYYVVIDIKFTTLHFRAGSDALQNAGVTPAYKGQVIMYNEMLGLAQNYKPKNAYLLGRAWKRIGGQGGGANHCLDRLGVVEPEESDAEWKEKMWKAIDWVRNVKTHASEWWQSYQENPNDPLPRPELYPNMCKTGNLDGEKRKLAIDLKEITLIWNCGFKHRAAAHELEIYGYDDHDCTLAALGIKKTERGQVIETMLNFHREDLLIWPETTKKMKNTLGWKQVGEVEYYLDFEFLTNVFDDFTKFPNVGQSDYLYLIGVYRVENGEGTYTPFMMEKLGRGFEEKNLLAFLKFYESEKKSAYVNGKEKSVKLFHWGHAEESVFQRLTKTFPSHKTRIQKVIDNLVDFTAVLRDSPILVRGAYGFGLKEYGSAMVQNGQISASWEGSLKGDSSLIRANDYYAKPSRNEDLRDELIAYNKDDCQVTYEIIKYLRNLE
ncbi:hypothetical protein BNJ_00341 [Kaumoebavirus]|uniref:hypothetical protein n=1 Tax=Kaumoebavirus TaxID=1859492 RepID=UPI0009C3D799|nr:hypothetical protein BNJ_00341 [Kaumoebavirus]ARA72161.1 hypothetical protein BNJ_00341 [Kaumoebavirus]